MYDLIMPLSDLSRGKPDEQYQKEYEAAGNYTNIHLFNIMDFETIKLPIVNSRELIYHGWMMSLDGFKNSYKNFYNKCKKFGFSLINTPEQYQACHYFNGWYPALNGLTAPSEIIELNSLRVMAEKVLKFMHDNDCAIIIKDYVKSLKHEWYDACFIPKNSDILHVCNVLSKFFAIKKQYNDLHGNLVIRKFLNLKSIGKHTKSGMPLTKEFRTFVFKGRLINTFEYWEQGNYEGMLPENNYLQNIANIVLEVTKSNFFTIDVAQLEDGTWTCIEIGDGQVSAIPEKGNLNIFFKELLKEAE